MKMQSGAPRLNLSQSFLRPKLEYFLSFFGEHLPAWTQEGKCNGYTFMLFRANIVNESYKFWDRLKILAAADNNKIAKMATLLHNYKVKLGLNSQHQQDILQVLLAQNPNEGRAQFSFFISILSRTGLSDEDKTLLAQAEELYFFIHSLIYAQNPAHAFPLYRGNSDSSAEDVMFQNDFGEMLKFIPPNALLKNPQKQLYEYKIAFNFSAAELNTVFYDLNITNEDHIRLNHLKHVIYIYKMNSKFFYYDCNKEDEKIFDGTVVDCNSIEILVQNILTTLFPNHVAPNVYPSLEIDIFSFNPQQRPNPVSLIAKLLSARGVDKQIDAAGVDGVTGLQLAVHVGCYEIARLLLLYGANPNLETKAGLTAARLAAESGRAEMIGLLAEFNADLQKSNQPDCSPEARALSRGNLKTLEQLKFFDNQMSCADTSRWEHDLNLQTMASKSLAELFFLMKHQSELNQTTSRVLTALRSNDWNLLQVQFTLYQEARKIALYFATHTEPFDTNTITSLCEAGSVGWQVNRNRATVLIFAARSHLKLVESNASRQQVISSPMLSFVNDLLNKYAKYFTRKQLGKALIYLAVANERESILLLLRKRPDVNQNLIYGDEQCTVLHLAVIAGDLEIIKACCVKEYMNLKNTKGQTPLLLAASNGAYGIVDFFVSNYHNTLPIDELSQVLNQMLLNQESLPQSIKAQAASIYLLVRLKNEIANNLDMLITLNGTGEQKRKLAGIVVRALIESCGNTTAVMKVINDLEVRRDQLGYLFQPQKQNYVFLYKKAYISNELGLIFRDAQKKLRDLIGLYPSSLNVNAPGMIEFLSGSFRNPLYFHSDLPKVQRNLVNSGSVKKLRG